MKYPLESLYDDDAAQRYAKTFVRLHFLKDNTDKLAYVHEANRDVFVFVTQDKRDGLFYERPVTKNLVVLETLLPTSGWYQGANAAVHLYRKPQRQWKRSLCINTHSADFAVTGNDAGIIRWSADALDVWDALLKTKTLSFMDAVAHLKEKKLQSCVLANNFCLNDKGVLFNGTTTVGKVAVDAQTYRVNKIFKDEFACIIENTDFKDIGK